MSTELRELDREVSKIGHDVTALKRDMEHANENIAKLVSKAEFFPVKLIAYALAGGAMSAVMTAVFNLVVSK